MTRKDTNAANVFRQFGLGSPGLFGNLAVQKRDDGPGPGQKLKESFEQLGGVYLAFAEFLLWRADLLGVEYLTALRGIRRGFPAAPRDSVVASLRRQLDGKSDELTPYLDNEPVWSTLSRTAYLSQYKGTKVVVQVAREPVSESDLADLKQASNIWDIRAFPASLNPGVLAEFRQWLRQAESCFIEHSYLEVLAHGRDKALVDYPALIPEITTDQILCWPWVEGQPIDSLVRSGSVDAVRQVAVAVLEQFCSLSIVDADLQLDAMVMPPGGERLVIRRLNKPLAVPTSLVNTGMKYIAAVLEGRPSVTVQMLLNLALGKSSGGLESALLALLSAVEPELKVALWFPESAAAFESN